MGDAANDLTSFIADPNVSIEESKAFSGAIFAGRRSEQRRAAAGISPAAPPPEAAPRDLPLVAQSKKVGPQGLKSGQAKQTREA